MLEQEAHSQIRNVILGIFFLSLLFVGIGQTAVSTLGIPYIDDNVASKESAVYIGTTRALNILSVQCYAFQLRNIIEIKLICCVFFFLFISQPSRLVFEF